MGLSGEIYSLRLFTAGKSQESVEAIENLNKIKTDHLPDNSEIQIIDIKKNPELALANMVVVVPMLIMESPEPKVTIIGSLRDIPKVLAALRLNLAKRT